MRSAVLVAGAICLLAPSAHADGIAPVSSAQCETMRARNVIHAGVPVGCDRLSLVTFTYTDFGGRTHDDGQIVVLDVLANNVLAIFRTLHAQRFPIASARPMEAFGGDDDASMAENNTSAFNHRAVAGSASISVHAFGATIDLNPVQNPYVVRGPKSEIAPPAGAAFLQRNPQKPGMAEGVIGIFARHGFADWGGRWRSETDYQHFAVPRALAARLASATREEAKRIWVGRFQSRR